MKLVAAGNARIPALGFGTWQLRDAAARDMVAAALAGGWRHIDTARRYENEVEVGMGLRLSDTPRADVFLTTKIWPDDHAPDALRAAAEDSVRRLGTEPDLILLHWPSKTVSLEKTMPALCALADDGLCAHVGVSNFTRPLIARASALASRPLATNQVEFHPWLDQTKMLEQLADKGMALTAYVPLAKGRAATDETLARIAARHGTTAAAVCLAWIMARGAIAIPKTANPARLAENMSAMDLVLTAEEIAEITALAEPDGRMVDLPGIAPVWDERAA